MPSPRVIRGRDPQPSWFERIVGRILGSKLRKAAWAALLVLALFASDCAEHYEHILGSPVVPEWVTGYARGRPEVVDVRVAQLRAVGQQGTIGLEISTRERLTSRVVVECALVDRNGGHRMTLRRALHAAGFGGALEPGQTYPLEMPLWIGELRGTRDGELWDGDRPLHPECAATRAR